MPRSGSASIRLGIVTGEDRPRLSDDGRALVTALNDRGLSAEPAVWTTRDDWSTFDAVLVRSCWRYYERPDAFREWIATVERAVPAVFNPAGALRWNRHKFYLQDLIDRGVDVLPTAFVERSSDRSLESILRPRGWDEAVVKPAVATSSAGAFRAALESAEADHGQFEALRTEGDVLVQQFAPAIHDGERSLVFFGGEFSHATVSRPTGDDFRAHPDFGVTIEPYDPPPDVLEAAGDALRAACDAMNTAPERLCYARVDGLERGGGFELMELELIEPYLGLVRSDAVERFADELEAALERELPAR